MARKAKNLEFKPTTEKTIEQKKIKNIGLNKSGRKSKEYSKRNIIKIYFNSLETEYNYFKEFKNELDKCELMDFQLQIEKAKTKGGCSPKELLNYVLKNRKDEESWIVFDKDDYKDINSVISVAEENDIKVAFSNPCFELWFLNHYDFRDTPLTTKQCLKATEDKMQKEHKIKYLKNLNYYKYLSPKTNIAIRNSEKQYKKISENEKNNDSKNPVTLVYQIVLKLNYAIKLAKEN